MTSKECEEQLNELIKYWYANTNEKINQTDINAIEHLMLENRIQHDKINELKAKYNKVLTMLANYEPPCELNNFMDRNTDYCFTNCSVDEEVFKECWDRYIDQGLKEES